MTAKTMTACSWKNADDCSTNFHYPPDSGMYSMTYSDAERYAAYRVRAALEEAAFVLHEKFWGQGMDIEAVCHAIRALMPEGK